MKIIFNWSTTLIFIILWSKAAIEGFNSTKKKYRHFVYELLENYAIFVPTVIRDLNSVVRIKKLSEHSNSNLTVESSSNLHCDLILWKLLASTELKPLNLLFIESWSTLNYAYCIPKMHFRHFSLLKIIYLFILCVAGFWLLTLSQENLIHTFIALASHFPQKHPQNAYISFH